MTQDLIASSDTPLIVGLGSTGLSCVRYFQRRGIPCAVVDSRAQPPGLAELRSEYPQMEVTLGEIPTQLLQAAGRLVVSPGISLEEPAVAEAIAAGVPVCGDIDLFCAEATAPVVGITGSNGKSTVTELLGRMVARSGRRVGVGGNLGPPALDLLDAECDLYVLELSSFQLERSSDLGLDVACVLNVSADHLDRHGSMQRYHHAKHKIFRACRALVFNRDDPLSRPLQADTVNSWSFGLGPADLRAYGLAQHQGETWLYREFEPLMPAADVGLVGRHNLANALAALALGEVLGLPGQSMLDELRVFAGLPHRCQQVVRHGGLRFINDSKATNPGATLAALRGLAGEGGLVLILGGQGKGADFTELCAEIRSLCKAAVLIGEDAELLAAGLGEEFPFRRADDMHAAVATAMEMAVAGDTVLLSPACASFDMYSGFGARGEAFIDSCRQLTAEAGND
ncbi:MAG: UDP-N-acetylmuramoyl-L-alanine--D-glutamate ligase [Halieaceae bacterium]